jgi:hypothetical protein
MREEGFWGFLTTMRHRFNIDDLGFIDEARFHFNQRGKRYRMTFRLPLERAKITAWL